MKNHKKVLNERKKRRFYKCFNCVRTFLAYMYCGDFYRDLLP